MSRWITKKTALAGLVTAGAMTVAIAAPTFAFAEDGVEPAATSSAAVQRPDKPVDRGGEHRAEHLNALAEALATELGVSQEDVTAALKKVRDQARENRSEGERPERRAGDRERSEGRPDRQAFLQERLDTAVSEGKLTREEADAVLKAYEAGVLPGPGRGGPDGGPGRGAPSNK